jgi:hypothetical protein
MLDRRRAFALLLLACAAALLLAIMYRVSAVAEAPVPASAPASEALPGSDPASPLSAPLDPPAAATAAGLGPITTEIKVLQPAYTVAAGDTLASIARRHGTTIEALASINNVENRNALSVGQRLVIP